MDRRPELEQSALALLVTPLALASVLGGLLAGCSTDEQSPRPECTTNTDCASGMKCEGGRCLEAHEEPECSTDQDCGPDQKCRGGRCSPGEWVQTGKSTECMRDLEHHADPACKEGAFLARSAHTLTMVHFDLYS